MGFDKCIYPPKVKVAQSCGILRDPMDCSPPGSSVHRDSPGQNTGVGEPSFFQVIFPTQESNQGHLHCRWILYQLSYQRSLLTQILSKIQNISITEKFPLQANYTLSSRLPPFWL